MLVPDREMINEWLMNLYREEIEDTKVTISNERMWEKGYNGNEPVNPHTENIVTLEEYIKVLQSKINEIKGS